MDMLCVSLQASCFDEITGRQGQVMDAATWLMSSLTIRG